MKHTQSVDIMSLLMRLHIGSKNIPKFIAPRVNYHVVIGLTPSHGDPLWIRRGLVSFIGGS